jgi:cell division initiation protein
VTSVTQEPEASGRSLDVEGHVRLTPLDIQNHRFTHRLRGFDPAEVDAFLRLVAEDFEALVKESKTLRDRVRSLELEVEELSSNEHALRETLVTAHAMSEDLKKTAVKESELKISEAEIKAEKILDASHRRAARLAEDIREMKLLRSRLGTALRTTIETHLALLEGLAEDPEQAEDPLADGKVTYLSRAAARES